MDFGPREVLIALGALLVCGIILDGVRRMRAARRGSLRGPRRQSIFDDNGPAEGHDSDELTGPARVVAIRDEQAAAEVNLNLRKSGDSVRTRPYRELGPGAARQEPGIDMGASQVPAMPDDAQAPMLGGAQMPERQPAAAPEAESAPGDTLVAERDSGTESAEKFPLDMDDLPLFRGEPAPEHYVEEAKPVRSARRGKRRGRAAAGAELPGAGAEEFDAVVVHVMAPPGQTFSARPLFSALQGVGLQFGERNIFHCYAGTVGSGGEPMARFSVANALKPGAFEGSVADFRTPGVAFFMLINDQSEPLAVFDDMLEAARATALELNAELKDERRAPLTRTGIAHYRQRIVDYSRRHGLSG